MKFGQFTAMCIASAIGNVIGLAGAFKHLEQTSHSFDSEARQAVLRNPGVSAAAVSDHDYTCTKLRRCKLGCCGPLDQYGNGECGLGPKFCGSGCTSSCNEKSECNPGWGLHWSQADKCRLKACCSDYGFCGTSASSCRDPKDIPPKDCSGRKASSNERTIGYYQGGCHQRTCGAMLPSQIPLGYYTHIFLTFSMIDPFTYKLRTMSSKMLETCKSLMQLKERQPGLQIWLSVGGWAMNEPSLSQTVFSDIAASKAHQTEFLKSLVSFVRDHGFDGVDVNWEYPGALDRGGGLADFSNFDALIFHMRKRLKVVGRRIGLSITLPTSYWYLRGFDIVNLDKHVDFFNLMAYDTHGIWDSTFGQPLGVNGYAHAHGNLTEFDEALDVLSRNGINLEHVNLGIGFYGRTFTMKSPHCTARDCEVQGGGEGGQCTHTPGVLSAAEMKEVIRNGAEVTLDSDAAVQIVTWNGDQWASWDDNTTFAMKVDFANKKCLGGVTVWAIDLDDGTMIRSLSRAGRRHTYGFYKVFDPQLAKQDRPTVYGTITNLTKSNRTFPWYLICVW